MVGTAQARGAGAASWGSEVLRGVPRPDDRLGLGAARARGLGVERHGVLSPARQDELADARARLVGQAPLAPRGRRVTHTRPAARDEPVVDRALGVGERRTGCLTIDLDRVDLVAGAELVAHLGAQGVGQADALTIGV